MQGAWKKPFTGRADLVIAIGFRFWSGEKFGQPPTWTDKATYVQVDATPDAHRLASAGRGGHRGRPETRAAATDRRGESPQEVISAAQKNSTWVGGSRRARENFRKAGHASGPRKPCADVPIQPDRLTRDLVSVVDEDATVVIDSFTLSGYISHWWTVRFPGPDRRRRPARAGRPRHRHGDRRAARRARASKWSP